MESVTRKLATRIRGLLDRLVATEHFSDDEKEEIFDEVIKEARKLPRENVLEALDQAIGSSKNRRQHAVFILSELTDVPAVVDRIGEWLRTRTRRQILAYTDDQAPRPQAICTLVE